MLSPSQRGYAGDRASRDNIRENTVLRQACQEIRKTRAITAEMKQTLDSTFEKRFLEAMRLVEQKRVTQVRFIPSGRTVWVVNGRKGVYQVVPESMFCTCDDYYFRVMGHKKQLCYHLIAQDLAEALDKQVKSNLVDSEYSGFTARWKPSTASG